MPLILSINVAPAACIRYTHYMSDAVDRMISSLFRAPPRDPVTPQLVAARALRLLRPAADFPLSRARAKWAAEATRRAIAWHELDALGLLIEREVDGPDRRSRQSELPDPNAEILADLDLMDLSQALRWGWQRRAHAADKGFRPLCRYCHRPSVGITDRGRARHVPVCAKHVPRSAAAQQAARLARWAGGDGALRERVLDEASRIRAGVSDAELESVLARSRVDRFATQWWSRHPALELPIRILAHQRVEAEYRKWVNAQRAAPGRARAVPREALVSAAERVRCGGVSIRAAAREAVVSEATLRRYLARLAR